MLFTPERPSSAGSCFSESHSPRPRPQAFVSQALPPRSLAFKAKPLKPEHSLNCARRCPSARLRAILAEWWSIMTIKTLGSVSIVKNDQTTRRAGRLSGEKTVRTGVLCAVSQGHLLLRRLYRKKCPGEGGYFAQTFRSLCGSVSEGVCLHSRARAARSLVVPALSGCERSGRACSQAARNLVMLAFPGYKGPGRTCPPKKIGPGRACPHGSRKFVALAPQVARDLRPERNRALSAYSPFPFRATGRFFSSDTD